jgi:hypothetical protein
VIVRMERDGQPMRMWVLATGDTGPAVCCAVCRVRVESYPPATSPHWSADGTQCPGMWPPFVAGAPQPARRAPVARHGVRRPR